ncbi:hypothetical protein E2C01_066783 [Portunus trituberculatus]|uniref:Uncharacterized protein n=1 Tax=Portunus trituberculatus TaxID=210409 RepID=A0A5B7HRW3_PORTR|nr:hypothetical protein [Portunus trituberculatus]
MKTPRCLKSNRQKTRVEAKKAKACRTSICKCPDCVLPFRKLLRAWELMLVKPPTTMDMYADILAMEYTVMREEANVLLKEKQSYASDLVALKAEMDHIERELDRTEALWAGTVMESEEDKSLQMEGTGEGYFGYSNEELWTEMLDNVSEGENKTLEEHFDLDEAEEQLNMKKCEGKHRTLSNTGLKEENKRIETPNVYEDNGRKRDAERLLAQDLKKMSAIETSNVDVLIGR